MKALSTVLIAGVEAPKTRVSMRVQMTSKTRPEAPERKKQRKGTTRAPSPKGRAEEEAAGGVDTARWD